MRMLLVGLLALGGCAVDYPMLNEKGPMDTFLHGYGPAVKAFPGPNGQAGYAIRCAGGARAAECYQAAAKVCGGTYEVLSRKETDEDDAVLDVLCVTPQTKIL